jgi:hypothetical protein
LPSWVAGSSPNTPVDRRQLSTQARKWAKLTNLCPKSGKNIDLMSLFDHHGSVMLPTTLERGTDGTPLDDLLDQLTRTTTLSRAEAQRVVEEILVFFSEPVDRFVKRRHTELQKAGYANPVIFERIQGELSSRRVAAPPVTVRQVRRIIYG